MNILRVNLLFFLMALSQFSYADFAIREPCQDDSASESKQGEKLKFYASLLAYNSEKPRCILYSEIISGKQVENVNLHNDPNTNDVIVDILLTKDAAQNFSDYSSQEGEEQIALIIDNKILAIITLNQAITDGKISVRGLWYEDSIRLSNAIKKSKASE